MFADREFLLFADKEDPWRTPKYLRDGELRWFEIGVFWEELRLVRMSWKGLGGVEQRGTYKHYGGPLFIQTPISRYRAPSARLHIPQLRMIIWCQFPTPSKYSEANYVWSPYVSFRPRCNHTS